MNSELEEKLVNQMGKRMLEDHTDKTSHGQNGHGVGVGHEISELKIGPIVWFLLGLGFATVVVCLLMAGLFDAFEKNEKDVEGKPSPLASERQKLPPEPRLQLAPATPEQLEARQPPNIKQDHPLQEMMRVRAEEDDKLKSYGWVDEKAGVVRIPIEEAKRLLLKNGLPARK
ncbi:MAG: hypothetical protein AABN33_02840 [Acidobacteriota bacterium]